MAKNTIGNGTCFSDVICRLPLQWKGSGKRKLKIIGNRESTGERYKPRIREFRERGAGEQSRKREKKFQFIKNSIAPKFWKDPLSCLRQKERMVKKPKLKRQENKKKKKKPSKKEKKQEKKENQPDRRPCHGSSNLSTNIGAL
jgi:hypothetical protein